VLDSGRGQDLPKVFGAHVSITVNVTTQQRSIAATSTSMRVTFATVKAALAAASSAVDFNGQKITGLAEPTVDTDAATKYYVDNNGGGGGGAPSNAAYVTIGTSAGLSAERTLAGESGVVSITDGGANAAVTIGLSAGGVTLAKMADLAQDQFIGRVTGSTGVPETATITAAARTVLDDASTAAMRTTLGAADSSMVIRNIVHSLGGF